MFHRVDYAQWADFVPIAAFCATFIAFLYFAIRAVRISKETASYLAHLPLQEQPDPTSSPHEH